MPPAPSWSGPLPSKREAAVQALEAVCRTLVGEVFRDSDLPTAVPVGGLIQLVEGEYQPEAMLSPLRYDHEMPVSMIVTIAGTDEADRDEQMDDLLLQISAAVEADRQLGGAVEWTEIGAPTFDSFEGEAGPLRAATVPFPLAFVTDGSPLA